MRARTSISGDILKNTMHKSKIVNFSMKNNPNIPVGVLAGRLTVRDNV